MPFAILQQDLAPPSIDQLKRAFRATKFLTEVDAHTLGRDAFGILVKNLTAENAALLQGALRTEGVETDLVDQQSLPEMPPTKFLSRLDCRPQGMLIYDPVGRGIELPWGHLMMIAAGNVRLTEFTQVRKVRPRNPYQGSYGNAGLPDAGQEVDITTREAQTPHLLLELILTRAVQRFSITADKFNFGGLGERRTGSLPENFALLARELIQFAPHAALNQGALGLRENAPELFSYPSKSAFFEEIIWLLWRIRPAPG